MTRRWTDGDRLYDADCKQYGTVVQVDGYYPMPVDTEPLYLVTVRWDGGGISDFTPDGNTIMLPSTYYPNGTPAPTK